MNGSRRGAGAGTIRATLSIAEPIYCGIAAFRNRLYDTGLLSQRKPGKPVISIGNLTAGGTGKTPMVRWLATELRREGKTVAILSRGYKSTPGQLGDEQMMLDRMLNGAEKQSVVIKANPDRFAAAEAALLERPSIDVFILDDGFQHRRVARDFDIVLLSAIDPFGLGHVLPRGLLRESISGLKRADAVIITHADQVDASSLSRIEQVVRQVAPLTPIYRAVHHPCGLRTSDWSSAGHANLPLEKLHDCRFFAFCGIGNTQAFDRQLQKYGRNYVGHRWLADHHAYAAADLASLRAEATLAGADVLVTTEKDWVKVAAFPDAGEKPEIWRLDVAINFHDAGADLLLSQIHRRAGL